MRRCEVGGNRRANGADDCIAGPEVARKAMQAERATLPDTATAATTAEVTLAAARLHWIHDEQPQCIKALRKAFDLADQAAVAAITGMSMVDRQITIFSTASHVALRAGNTKEAQAYSELVTSLQ